jgi:pimeloyl-ACP methyl ester carboxylesterase
MVSAEIQQRTVEARGMTIAYLEAGEGPLVVLTHGFPDTAESWRPTLTALAEAGFRAVAPFTRGIAPTTAPAKAKYDSLTLAEDILGLLDALGAEKTMLVGQDWGAMFSYLATSSAPERVTRLVTIAIPHPRSLKPQLRLIRGFWHFLFFQLPWLPEWFMKRGGLRGIDFFFNAWSPSTDWTGRLNEIKASYASPGTLRAALGYYRAMFKAPLGARAKQQQRLLGAKIGVPTLTFAGLTDGALPATEFDRAERSYTAQYELVKVPEGGHFLHLERPDLFHPKLIEFLSTE